MAERGFYSFPNTFGSYVSTVGLNETTIAKYIREQDKQDQMMDRISTKELDNPFKGPAR